MQRFAMCCRDVNELAACARLATLRRVLDSLFGTRARSIRACCTWHRGAGVAQRGVAYPDAGSLSSVQGGYQRVIRDERERDRSVRDGSAL